MPTNPEHRNHLSRLLGGDANTDASARTLLGQSPFNAGNLALASVSGAYANTYVEHFNRGTTIPAGLVLTEEGTTTAAATYGTGLGGRAVITSDDVAAKTDQLTTQLLWQANRQPVGYPLIAEFRWKTGATITASEYWIGLTDANPDTDPIALSTTSTFTTSVPTDGVYMGYSATPTSGAAFTTGGNQHTAISISTNTDTIVATGAGIFVAATDYIYRFEVDYLGNCNYYVNGYLLGSKTVALNPAVPLCAMVCASPRTTVSAAISVDYIAVAGA